jgi:two-component system sensor histidine kinase TctE
MKLRSPATLRWRLLAGIVLPITAFVAFDAWSTYRRVLESINTAYDRSLLASARSIGELLQPVDQELRVEVPYAALEIFEAGNEGRMVYRVSGVHGEFLSGYADLPPYTRTLPQRSAYAALVDFYDSDYGGERVRMAALYQPVAGPELRGVALIQVAETLEIRERHARALLVETLLRHALMVAVVGAVAAVVVARALRPVNQLRDAVSERDERDLSALVTPGLPTELRPVTTAMNDLMARLAGLIAHQRQFVRDASHQLRTPLAVLKTQVQNGLSGHVGERETLQAMHGTIDRAIRLANQMLALAKVEQVHQQDAPQTLDLCEPVREVALDLAPLIADKELDFELEADQPVWIEGHAWMLRELTRNLLHNAIRATPAGAPLVVSVDSVASSSAAPLARLRVRDSGPGLDASRRAHLYEPFHTGTTSGTPSGTTTGSGLGLAICRQICERLGGEIRLVNQGSDKAPTGLDAIVTLPAAAPTTQATHMTLATQSDP